MKHLKTFENNDNEQVEILDKLLNENPLNKDNDFYMFLGSDEFIEDKNGLYKKSINIEKMVRITADETSISNMKGLELRQRFQTETKLYHIWLPKEFRNDVEFKSSNSIAPHIVELINKYKQSGSDSYGKKVYNDILKTFNDIKKFNL